MAVKLLQEHEDVAV